MNNVTKAAIAAFALLLVAGGGLAVKNSLEERRRAKLIEARLEARQAPAEDPTLVELRKMREEMREEMRKEIENMRSEKDQTIGALQRKVAASEAEISKARQDAEARAAENEVLDAKIDEKILQATTTFAELTPEQKRIKSAAPFAQVKSFNSEWDFAVITAGKVQGVDKGMKFAVRRDHYIIGEVEISTVERDEAIASLVPRSTRPGLVIRKGDDVIASDY